MATLTALVSVASLISGTASVTARMSPVRKTSWALSYSMAYRIAKVGRADSGISMRRNGTQANFNLLTTAAAAVAASASGNTPTLAAASALSTSKYPVTSAVETKVASASPSESQLSAKTDVANLVSTYTSGSNTLTTTFQSSVNVLATGVSESDASTRGLYNNSTLTSKKTDGAGPSSTFQAEASTTARSSSSSVSQGGVAPMVTGALNGLVNVPIAFAAAAVLML